MDGIDFLSLEDVLFVHQDQTTRYGGDASVLDFGLLESALSQPRASFGGQLMHANLHEMATAYLFHIVQNHAFVDGNKRTGAVAALVFLALNGTEVSAPPGALYDVTISVASGEAGKPDVVEFFRTHASAT